MAPNDDDPELQWKDARETLTPPQQKVPPIGGGGSPQPQPSPHVVPIDLPPSPPLGGGGSANWTPPDPRYSELHNPFTAPVDPNFGAAGAGMPEYPRQGKYIFTVGRPGSGKSTLQSHLLRYLRQGGDHILTLDPEFTSRTSEFNRVLAKWEDNWQVGVFPDATDVNRPREFRYSVTPLQNGKPNLDFGFVEVSGEDFRVLETAARSGQHAQLHESLNSFLANPNCDIAFLFVANGENVGGDDRLFRLFLEYLDSPRFRDREFRRTCTAILVIAYPELALRRLEMLWNEKIQADEISREDITEVSFAETFLPGTTAMLKSWDPEKRGIILPFSVGRIETRTVGSAPIPVIVEPSFRHAKALFDWLYWHFTGQRLGPPAAYMAWRRFLRRLSSMVTG